MPDLFTFSNTDTLVTTYLNTAERAAVTTWQTAGEFQFEFHTGHGTGEPVYVRPVGNKDTKNLPKFDTLNKTHAHYHGRLSGKSTGTVSLSTLANGSKLVSALPGLAQANLESVIQNSWAALSLIAHRYWNGIAAPADVIVAPVAVDKACTTPTCAGRVTIVSSGKSPCDTCFAFQ